MKDSEITFYFYTAWNGYAWQGCDESTSADLQRYIEATGTLPKSDCETPPPGGAIACLINGKMGVAVYRYHIRKQGDAFGRDSLYIALAFIPCDAPDIDFALLLSSETMRSPLAGELSPRTLPAADFELREKRLQGLNWFEESFTREYGGEHGLCEVSQLFLTPETQLGLLQAKFFGNEGSAIDRATVDYAAFPEVSTVAAASRKLEIARQEARGSAIDSHPALIELKAALAKLEERAKRIPAYWGLASYIEEKRGELDTSRERNAQFCEYVRQVDQALASVKSYAVDCRSWPARTDFRHLNRTYAQYDLEKFLRLADDVATLPAVDGPAYHAAVKKALQLKQEAIAKIATIEVLENLLKRATPHADAVLDLIRLGGIDPHGHCYRGLSDWAAACQKAIDDERRRTASRAPARQDHPSQERAQLQPERKANPAATPTAHSEGLRVSPVASAQQARRSMISQILRWLWSQKWNIACGTILALATMSVILICLVWLKGCHAPTRKPPAKGPFSGLAAAQAPSMTTNKTAIGDKKPSAVKAPSPVPSKKSAPQTPTKNKHGKQS